MSILGEAGIGKTHLTATLVSEALRSGQSAIMLLGNAFLSDSHITSQITDVLNIDYSFEDFLNVLEGIGERDNKISIIVFDALNESSNVGIWKVGLPALINKIQNCKFVRAIFTLRSGYESLIYEENILEKIKNGEICGVIHSGFKLNPIQAIKEFTRYYNIPFSFSYYLRTEMTNPLFLKLFCENYAGADYNIFSLFDKVVKKANQEALKAIKKEETSQNLLGFLLDDLSEKMLLNHGTISRVDLYGCSFWNLYGLNDKKIEFVNALEKNGILIRSAYGDEEFYYLEYNLLADYLCAKFALNGQENAQDAVEYIINSLLKIKDGEISEHGNIEVFIVLCGLFAEKFGKECIDVIDFEKNGYWIIDQYVESFLWRKSNTINVDDFEDFIKKHFNNIQVETLGHL